MSVTMILPYYRAPKMLRLQLENYLAYPDYVREKLRLIIVDDGSAEPALDVVKNFLDEHAPKLQPPLDFLPLKLFRILKDISWNRGGARNLGSQIATTPWLLHLDIDHLLPPAQATALLDMDVSSTVWYRFERWRLGAADDTRKKDACDPAATFAKIKPHGDSYLCPRSLYWKVGGYDEDYSGCLGGGSPFLAQLEAAATVRVLPIALHVVTRSVCADASVSTLDRDTSEYKRRRKLKTFLKNTRPRNPLRFEWEQQL